MIQVYISNVDVKDITEKEEPRQTGVQYPRGLTSVMGSGPDMLDKIEVSVVGSMYDDIV